jgi:hypothetical protein
MFAPSGDFRRVKFIVINTQQIDLALRICECGFPLQFTFASKAFESLTPATLV